MASGISKRFGSNKLLADFCGKRFIDLIIDATEGDMFHERVVVTRSKDVADICEVRNVNVILHSFEGRNDTVRLGLEAIGNCDACIFCPSDQPLLSKDSLKKMIDIYEQGGKGIYRFSAHGNTGTPVLFSKEFFEDLLILPEKKGGSWVIKKNPQSVILVDVENPLELYDVDTQEEFENLKKIIKDRDK